MFTRCGFFVHYGSDEKDEACGVSFCLYTIYYNLTKDMCCTHLLSVRYLLLVLVVIGYCCNAIPSNYNQFSVLLSSTEDIESGAVFSVATDTVINETLSHSIFLKHLNETIETDIVNNVSLTLTINKKETFHLDPETTKVLCIFCKSKHAGMLSHCSQINLTHANNSLTKYGCNELRLQYNPTYTLHPKRELSDAHLLTISVSKYYHLYLFSKQF